MTFLASQEQQILLHLLRYRLSVPEVVARLFFEGEAQAAEAALLSLCEKEVVSGPHTLYEGRFYYELSERSFFEVFGADPVPPPLSRYALAKAYGLLGFCCLGALPRERLLRAELEQLPGGLCRQGMPSGDYYLERQEEGRRILGLAYVDRHREKAVERTREATERAAKHALRNLLLHVQKIAQRHDALPGFRALRVENAFHLTLLTGSCEQAERLHRAFSRTRLPLVPRVVVVADLLRVVEYTGVSPGVATARRKKVPRTFKKSGV